MKKNKINFAILSTIDNPLLYLYLRECIKYRVRNIHVICDSKLLSDKDVTILKFRIGNYLETRNIYCLKKKYPFFLVDNHNSNETLKLIKKLNISCALNAGTPRKLSKKFIKFFKNGVLNIHPGLLPYYRGCTAVEWAIYNNDKVGNTIHFMDQEYDSGPIIKKQHYKFNKNMDYKSIRTSVYKKGSQLAAKTLLKMQNGLLKISSAETQDLKKARYWKPIPKNLMQEVLCKLKNKKYKYQTI